MGAAPYRPRHLQPTQRIWACNCGGPRAATNFMHIITCCDCDGPAPAWVAKRHRNQLAGPQPPGGGKVNPFSPAPGAPAMRPLSQQQLGVSPFATPSPGAPPPTQTGGGKGARAEANRKRAERRRGKSQHGQDEEANPAGEALIQQFNETEKISVRARSWAQSRTSSMPCASRRTASKPKWKPRVHQLLNSGRPVTP